MLSANDYVHYTTSNVLLILPQTNYALHSMYKLVQSFGIAPLSGEIHGGGGEGLINDMPVAFAQLNSTYWSRDCLLESYGKEKRDFLFFPDEAALLKKLTDLGDKNFSQAIIVILEMLQQQQTTDLPTISIEKRRELDQQLTTAHDRVVRLLILSSMALKFFQLHENALQDPYSIYKGSQFFYDVQTVQKNLDRIPLDFFDQTTKEQFDIAENLFSQVFDISSKEPSSQGCRDEFYKAILFSYDSFLLDPTENKLWIFLSDCLVYQKNYGILREEQRNDLARKCQETIKILDDYLVLIVKTLDGSQTLNLSSKQKKQVDSPFPMAFFVSHTMGELMQPTKYEFRALESLVLGSHIKIVGVHPENQAQLMEFLQTHNLADKVSVVDIRSTRENTVVLHSPLAVSEAPAPITHQFERLSLKPDNPPPPVSKEEASTSVRQFNPS